ncbi:hypothetical protein PCASD_14619 [Puccinia coronata f. sp. avenae]|uniref:DH domain-containing protein n=1 Tax=Puccinia coronata f. sp. avenae TaxID=200324 RepID=A0A2N5TUQ7_9BASI|nr:hypothetical protein PCASD_14619 [Puccinia coronata f. sp. avenae]
MDNFISFPASNSASKSSNSNSKSNSTTSPPLPPKLPHGIRRKISLPSLSPTASILASTTTTSSSSSHRHPPPVPPLPTGYSNSLDLHHPRTHTQQQSRLYSEHHHRLTTEQQPRQTLELQRPTHDHHQRHPHASFSSQSTSPLNIFKRSIQHSSSRSISSHLTFSQSPSPSPHNNNHSSRNSPPVLDSSYPPHLPSPQASRNLPQVPQKLAHQSSPNTSASIHPSMPTPTYSEPHPLTLLNSSSSSSSTCTSSSSSSSSSTSTSTSTATASSSTSTTTTNHPPHHHPINRTSSLVSYTNILHDYDQPLGAHSIPTRISTRPICFTSTTDPSSSSDQIPSSFDPRSSQSADPPPFLPPIKQSFDEDCKLINQIDRDLILAGAELWHEPANTSQPQDDDNIPLQIYTTRPSTEAPQHEIHRTHRRATSINDISPNHHPPTGLSSSLSVERASGSIRTRPSTKQPRGEMSGSKMSQIVLEPSFNIACLSHVAKFLQDYVPRDTKIKGNVEYPMAFTGRDAVTVITHCLNRVNPSTKSTTQATLNRKLALSLSQALLAERFFHEVTNSNHEASLNDNINEVYIFPHVNQISHSWIHPKSLSASTNSSLTRSQSLRYTRIHLPQGVLTSLTKCYSFSCQMAGPNTQHPNSSCYSYDCPLKKNRTSAIHHPSNLPPPTSLHDTSTASSLSQTKDWASMVSKDLLSSLDSKEIARQSIIHELISGEQEYVQDLDDYEKLFIIPLMQANPPTLPSQRLMEFKEKVVSNVLEIRDHNRVLLQNLLIRQQDQHPLVKGIGDVILNSALEWGQDYIRYTSDHVFGEAEVNEEKTRNLTFAELINKIPKLSPRRADFKHYHSRAFVRLQRYNLLLESLLKKTPDGHEDRASIEDAMEVIRRQCKEADQAVSLQQAKLNLVRLNNEIVTKPDTPDLQLLSPNRQLIFSGKMLRKPEGGTGLSEWPELHAMLFDHYFLLTKVKRIDEHTHRYHLARPPVMLELMRVTGFNDPCERKSRGLRTITGTLGSNGGLERGNSDPYSSSSASGGATGGAGGPLASDSLFPITIQSLGRNSYSSTMYVETDGLRLSWKTKFEEAIGLRMQILDSFKVFDLYPMTDQTFAASGSVASHSSGAHANGSGALSGSTGSATSSSAQQVSNRGPTVGEALSNMHGPPTCSVPFRSSDGKRLIAIGCMDGLWIGLRNDPGSMKQVIYLKSITQCAVLQEFGFLLVLAEKILMAYPLDSLIPSRNSPAVHPHHQPTMMMSSGPGKAPVRAIASRLSGNKDVLFFRCGKVGPRTLVIYVKKGGVNQTVFKALEPVRNSENAPVAKRGLFGIGGNRSDSFRGYKEFFVPSESYAIQYLRNTLTIHCARGFEIMNIDTLKTASIPDFHQIKQQDARLAALQRRCDESRPLGMFRLGENEFLLCYDEFAFFADKHGDPLVDRYGAMMEWDGKPTTVAYSAPYVICFSSTLVEVWNTITSRRVQIILGHSIQCTYDGGALGDDGSHARTINIDHPLKQSLNSSQEDEGERRVHVMMKDADQFYRVFEMVPLTLH